MLRKIDYGFRAGHLTVVALCLTALAPWFSWVPHELAVCAFAVLWLFLVAQVAELLGSMFGTAMFGPNWAVEVAFRSFDKERVRCVRCGVEATFEEGMRAMRDDEDDFTVRCEKCWEALQHGTAPDASTQAS